ncbi:hypothetical protein F5884DRAFT_837499 [Xylogone sp. PMI_703]|nr:hypothetical protein F5884DRAFT_837499 [Xylogone sp. PMI_703]
MATHSQINTPGWIYDGSIKEAAEDCYRAREAYHVMFGPLSQGQINLAKTKLPSLIQGANDKSLEAIGGLMQTYPALQSVDVSNADLVYQVKDIAEKLIGVANLAGTADDVTKLAARVDELETASQKTEADILDKWDPFSKSMLWVVIVTILWLLHKFGLVEIPLVE